MKNEEKAINFLAEKINEDHIVFTLSLDDVQKNMLFEKDTENDYCPTDTFFAVINSFIENALPDISRNFTKDDPIFFIVGLSAEKYSDKETSVVCELFNPNNIDLGEDLWDESLILKEFDQDEKIFDGPQMMGMLNDPMNEFELIDDDFSSDQDFAAANTYMFHKRDYLNNCFTFGEFLTAAARSESYIVSDKIYIEADNKDDGLLFHAYNGQNIEMKTFCWAKEKGKSYSKMTKSILLL